jgi:hypothetical protein
MYIIQFSYFDKKGYQNIKTINAKTHDGIMKKLQKEKEIKDFYMILGVSPNLQNISFEGAGV